jgi:hypothetical protein
MAEHGAATEIATATGNDYAEHQRTYRSFIRLTKWGTLVVAVGLIFVMMVLF